MAYTARIEADSVNAAGSRLTTFVVTFPRIVLAEFNTHRQFSRNAASSRAIPIERMLEAVETDPFIPEVWGSNKPGMQAGEPLSPMASKIAMEGWLGARDDAAATVRYLCSIGAHKQIVNRLLEPWLWTTVVVTATNYSNFFHLRCHPAAQPEIQKIAVMMRDLYQAHEPVRLERGEWHLPCATNEDRKTHDLDTLRKVSVARCARVSYVRHEQVKPAEEDIALHDRLKESGHWSPFEHQASVTYAYATDDMLSNLGRGWRQYRKLFKEECR